MDHGHRKRIIDNIDRLISRTDFEKLSHACVTMGLLNEVMLENVKRIHFSDHGMTDDEVQYQRHKRLFWKITKRGPAAFDILRRIFADLKYDSALGILLANDSYVSIHNNKTSTTTTGGTTNGVVSNADVENENTLNNNNNDRRNSSNINSGQDNQDGSYQQIDRRRSSTKSLNDETILREYDGEIRPREVTEVRKAKCISKHPSLEVYPMESKENRGVFFMVNMIDFLVEDRRDGAEEDGQSLLYLFKELGFKIFSYKNLSHTVFFKLLDELIKSDYTKNTECFVMALMTHGNMEDCVQRITFSDGSIVKVQEIEAYFHHHVCQNLVNKPKIFLFPFCRGDISERGVQQKKLQTDSIKYSSNRANNIPLLSDLFVCYATSEGFKSHRDPEEGSWYIQSFVKNMANNAHDTSFDDIIKKTQFDTSKLRTDDGLMQTANFSNKGFNKALYFNPGVWLE